MIKRVSKYEIRTDLKKIWISSDRESNRIDIWKEKPYYDFKPGIYYQRNYRLINGLMQIPIICSSAMTGQPTIDFFKEQIGLPEKGDLWEVTLK